VIYERETLPVVTLLEWNKTEIMGTYNTPDTIISDKRTKGGLVV